MVLDDTGSHGGRPAPAAPVRLRMAEHSVDNHLDGGWWPRTQDLATELAALVDQLPGRLGRVVRAVVPDSGWEQVPAQVRTSRGVVTVEISPAQVPHLVLLTTDAGIRLDVLVVPSWFTPGQGEEALLASATAGNIHAVAELLREVTDQLDADPDDRWSDHGGSWWEPPRVADAAPRQD